MQRRATPIHWSVQDAVDHFASRDEEHSHHLSHPSAVANITLGFILWHLLIMANTLIYKVRDTLSFYSFFKCNFALSLSNIRTLWLLMLLKCALIALFIKANSPEACHSLELKLTNLILFCRDNWKATRTHIVCARWCSWRAFWIITNESHYSFSIARIADTPNQFNWLRNVKMEHTFKSTFKSEAKIQE